MSYAVTYPVAEATVTSAPKVANGGQAVDMSRLWRQMSAADAPHPPSVFITNEFKQGVTWPEWSLPLFSGIRSFGELEDGWEGEGSRAPTRESIAMAESLLEALVLDQYRPSRVSPWADGGTAIWFFSRAATVRIVVEPDGGADAILKSADGEILDSAEFVEDPLPNAVKEIINRFLALSA